MLPGTDGLALCRWIPLAATAGDHADRARRGGRPDRRPRAGRRRLRHEAVLAARAGGARADGAAALAPRRALASASSSATSARRRRRGRCARPGERSRLTAKEFDLLCFLAAHPRQVFSRDQLMSRVWGYEAALDTGTVTVHVRRLREKIEDDPSEPAHSRRSGASATGSCRDRVRASSSRSSRSSPGSRRALALRLLPTRAPAAGRARACSPSACRSASVLVSGWVMFHMGDDVKILAVAAAAASVGRRGALRSRARSRPASSGSARIGGARRAATSACGLPSTGRPSSPSSARRSTRWPRASSSSSTRAASSSPGPATTCARRSPRSRRCSRRSRTGSRSPTSTSPALREQTRRLGALVDDLFELARIDAGALALELRDVGARHRSSSRACAGSRPRRARATCSSSARRRHATQALCAPEQVERVLLNLLTNALRHTPSDGTVAVVVSAAERSRPGHGRGHRRGSRADATRADVRPLLARRLGAGTRAAPGSGSRSRAGSSRLRAGGSGPSRGDRRHARLVHVAALTRQLCAS